MLLQVQISWFWSLLHYKNYQIILWTSSFLEKKIYPVLYPGSWNSATDIAIFYSFVKINTDKIFFQLHPTKFVEYRSYNSPDLTTNFKTMTLELLCLMKKSNKEITKIYHVYFCIITFLCMNKETFMSINIIQFVIHFSRCPAIIGRFWFQYFMIFKPILKFFLIFFK